MPSDDEGFAGGQGLPSAVLSSCQHCGTTNTLTVVDTPSSQRVTCSHCGADLGTLGVLANPEKPPVRETSYRLERFDVDLAPRKRQMSPEVLLGRQIRASIKPVHRSMPKWHARSVWIEARLNGKRPEMLTLRSEANVLLSETRQGRDAVKKLEEEIAGAAGNLTISDTLRSLQGIETRVVGVLKSLEA